ncbi:Lipid III flippase [termite gut metagenome]|uniref:Lipid III flippase n=1 Tax=termite gut metagenome TaxID=433724 RepID=A0A5J4RLK2_9ZZZZ
MGIIPAMIVLAVVSYIVNRYYSSKIQLSRPEITIKEVFNEGTQMFSLGTVLMMASLIGTITSYIINVYIRQYGSLNDVGLYQAATSITNQYVGLIFASMAMDYFPRLAAMSNNRIKMQEVVIHQLDIVMLIIVPILIGIMVTAPLIIRVLLTKEFLPIIPMLRWLVLGLFFKAFSYPIGYVSFSKGDKKTFLWFEGIFGNIVNLTFSIISYRVWGLLGLGIAYTATYILYTTILSVIVKERYNISINSLCMKMITPLFMAVFISFIIFQINQYMYLSYMLSILILIAITIYSYKELNKRIAIKEFVLLKLKKK